MLQYLFYCDYFISCLYVIPVPYVIHPTVRCYPFHKLLISNTPG